MNGNNLSFSQRLSNQRLARACSIFGKRVVQKILCLALYLLGVNRRTLASFLDLPPDSVRTFLRNLHTRGLISLHDRRCKDNPFQLPSPPPSPPQPVVRIQVTGEDVLVDMGHGNAVLRLPLGNKTQLRVVLLTLVHNGHLSAHQVSDLLHLSRDHTTKLARQLCCGDVPAILDHRRGQLQDYRFTPEIKSDVIQQYVLHLLSGNKTTGQVLAKGLQQRLQVTLSPRTILYHLEKMGLHRIKDSLPRLLTESKKNSGPS